MVEKKSESARKGGLTARGAGYWQTRPERLEEICELNKELSWSDTTIEYNRRHETEYTVATLRQAVYNNRQLIVDYKKPRKTYLFHSGDER